MGKLLFAGSIDLRTGHHYPELEVHGMGTRVVLVSSHPLSIEGLVKLLLAHNEIFEMVGVLEHGEELWKQATSLNAEVMLFDCESSELLTSEFHAALQGHMDVQVVVFNAPDDIFIARECLAGGVSAYVLKSDTGEQVMEALRAAVEGKQWLSPMLGAQAVQFVKKELPDLNERELAVLELLAKGLSNQEIAATLSLAKSTVKNKVSNFYGLLGASNRGQLVLMAGELVAKFLRSKDK